MRLKARSPPRRLILAQRRTSAAATIGALFGMTARGETRVGSGRFAQAVLQLFHAGDEQLPLARRLGRPQILGAVGEVDVVVAGDQVVLHRVLLGCSGTARNTP